VDGKKIKETVKDYKGFFGLSAILALAVYIRWIPSRGMEYLQALDSYVIYRYSHQIAMEWSLPAIDFMRYFPYAFPTYRENIGAFYIPAITYWFGPFLFMDYITWAQFYPALIGGGLAVIATYYIGKEAFNRETGLFSAFFLATIAGVLHRSSAGFFQKDPTSAAFMLISMYFFIRAWKRSTWKSGILSGLTLGLATISWGGSSMLWLLYALTIGIMLWINEDIQPLIKAYTPAVIIGGFLAFSINHNRFWITDVEFLGNMAMLVFLWSRHLVEELKIIKEENLGYYTPVIALIGGVAAALSPIYSQFIANNFVRLIGYVTGSGIGSGVIGGTVAENTPVTLGELSSQLGALGVAESHIHLGDPLSTILEPFMMAASLIANINGAWPLAFLGVVFLSTSIVFMILNKLEFVEDTVEDLMFYKVGAAVLVVWVAAFSIVFEGATVIAIGPAILALIGGIGILYSLEELGERKIEIEWYHTIIVLWAVSNILSAANQSRLIFLASFPTAFMAGYMFTKVVERLRSLGDESIKYLSLGTGLLASIIVVLLILLSNGIGLINSIVIVAVLTGVAVFLLDGREFDNRSPLTSNQFRTFLLTILITVTVLVNAGSAYTHANSLGGSPNDLWMENLDYLSEESEPDSVVLSWWDYGYHFQSIGNRATVADGGNLGYYTDEERMPFRIADFFTSEDPEEHAELFEKHSADYIVLDETMIGKYSAVSQIANRDNENFDMMVQMETSQDIQQSFTEDSEDTLINFQGQGLQAYVPVRAQEDGSITFSDSAPTIEVPTPDGRSIRGEAGCKITSSGLEEYEDVDQAMELEQIGEVCIAENPYFSMDRSFGLSQQGFSMPSRLVLVPRDIAEHTMIRLYFMDGEGVDFVEPVPEGSNDFIKTWRVDHDEL